MGYAMSARGGLPLVVTQGTVTNTMLHVARMEVLASAQQHGCYFTAPDVTTCVQQLTDNSVVVQMAPQSGHRRLELLA